MDCFSTRQQLWSLIKKRLQWSVSPSTASALWLNCSFYLDHTRDVNFSSFMKLFLFFTIPMAKVISEQTCTVSLLTFVHVLCVRSWCLKSGACQNIQHITWMFYLRDFGIGASPELTHASHIDFILPKSRYFNSVLCCLG